MKSKNQTPLGCLMRLLDVSLRDISEYVYVARTSVSKWKTGARVLRPDSQHFTDIIGYFLALSRDVVKGDRMRRLLGSLYPGEGHQTRDELEQCLRAFLSGKQLPPEALAFSQDERGRLYSAQLSVYSGQEGFSDALARLFLQLDQMEPPACLSLVDKRLAVLDARACGALAKGHRVRVLISEEAPLPVCGGLLPVLSHPKLELRVLSRSAPLPEGVCFAAIGDRMALFSSAFGSHPRYTSIHTDEMTVAQHDAAFSALWAQASAPFETLDADALSAEACGEALAMAIDRRLDWVLPSLPFLTMRRELLMEVLGASDTSGRRWSRALDCFDVAKSFHLRMLIPAEAVRDPTEPLKVLSMLAGVPIPCAKGQYQRHLLDTAALLRRRERAELLLLPRRRAELLPQGAAFVWRNTLCGYMDFASRTIRFTRSPALVDGCMRGVDALAGELTAEMQSPQHVAGVLEAAALTSCQTSLPSGQDNTDSRRD